MKNILNVISALLLFTIVADAQQKSRLIAIMNNTNQFGQWQPQDSFKLNYKDGSKGVDHPGETYLLNMRLMCDTVIRTMYNAGQWWGELRMVSTFDALGRNTEYAYMERSDPGGHFSNSLKTKYTYDANGNMVKSLNERWDFNIYNWKNETMAEYTYISGNLEKHKQYVWKDGVWVLIEHIEYTYTGSLQKTYSRTLINPASGHVTSKDVYIYDYDGKGRLVEEIAEKYDVAMMTISVRERNAYTLDAAGNKQLAEYQIWDFTNAVWRDANRSIYTLDNKGRNIKDSTIYWHTLKNEWVPFSTTQYTYDSIGNILERISSRWDDGSTQFITERKGVAEWNDFGQLLKFRTEQWNAVTGQWTGDMEQVYYYELYTPTVSVGETPVAMADVKLYPVPANDVLNIDASWQTTREFYVTITDMQGQLVRSWKENATTHYNKQIPLHSMANGNYLITLSDGTASTTKHFVITR